jgi:hypothetical protein
MASENSKAVAPREPRPMPAFNLPVEEESKLRTLATELAKDILEPEQILNNLHISHEQYDAIKETRAFRYMYAQACAEWNSAANTQKRIKLLAASTVEAALPIFWSDFNNANETLNARVGLLQTLAKIGGLGVPDPSERVAGGPGQTFKLEIHLSNRQEPITILASSNEASNTTIDSYDDDWDSFEAEP